MKNILHQNKAFFIFLGKFLGFYILFTFLYQSFLSQYDASINEVDAITNHVSEKTYQLVKYFQKDIAMFPNTREPSFKFKYKDKFVCRIVEGCNAISVIVLFSAFIFAFSTKYLKTFLYIVFGSIFIYLLNIARIAILVAGLYYYPEKEHLLHGVVFPVIIYGIVVLLWIVWIMKFSGYEAKRS